MNITIAFSGTRHGTPAMFPLVGNGIERAIELVLLRERQNGGLYLSGVGCAHAITIVHGASPVLSCLDYDAERVARQENYTVKRFPVDVSLDGKWPAAGGRRSHRMIVQSNPDILLAMPLSGPRFVSRGTWTAVESAVLRHVMTLIVPVG
jgi:hypothetical protein